MIAKPIRIACELGNRGVVTDEITGAQPVIVRSEDCRFELGCFYGESIQSVANITTLRLEVRSARTGTVVLGKTLSGVAVDNSLTSETWSDRTKQHAVIEFTATETSAFADVSTTKDFWLIVKAATSDSPTKTVAWAYGFVTVEEAGVDDTVGPPTPPEDYLTASEISLSYVKRADGPLNILWYGADPTGVTDSTDAFNDAIVAGAVTGNSVFVPAGDYLISNEIVMEQDVHLWGISSFNKPQLGPTIRLDDDADCNMIRVPAGAWNATISGLHLHGNRDEQNETDLCGILFENTPDDSDRTTTRDVFIEHVSGYGIKSTRSDAFFDCVQVEHCIMGIYCNGTHDNTWRDPRTSWNDTYGMYLYNATDTYYNLWTYNNGETGLVLDMSSYCQFFYMMSDANGHHGVDVTVSVDGHWTRFNTFYQCRISCNSQGHENTYSNLHFGGAGAGSYTVDNTFIGCQFFSDTLVMTVWPKYLIEDAGTYTGWTQGARSYFLGCMFIKGATGANSKHFTTARFTAAFEAGAMFIGCYDFTDGQEMAQTFKGGAKLKDLSTITWNGTNTVGLQGDNANLTLAALGQILNVGPLTDATASAYSLRAPKAVGTNINGPTLNILAGYSTGTGLGGPIRFYVTKAGASGNTVNTPFLTARMQQEMLLLGSGVYLSFNDTAAIHVGGASPEGSVSAPVGSLFLNTNGSTGTTLYVKETGSGNTGWVAK